MKNIKTLTILTAAFAICAVSSTHAAIVFSSDFQSPDVTGNTTDTTKQRDASLWVNGGTGFGSDRHGVVDEDSGAFEGQATPGTNDGEQAYAFRYTSSPAIMSAAGATGTNIADGQTITLTFDAVEDLLDNEGAGEGLEYNAFIFALDTGASGFTRTIGGTGVTTLASLTGSVSAGVTTWTTDITLSYTITAADSALFGQELAIGFQDSWNGNTTNLSSSMIDNVSVDVIPEPSSFALIALAGFSLYFLRRRKF